MAAMLGPCVGGLELCDSVGDVLEPGLGTPGLDDVSDVLRGQK